MKVIINSKEYDKHPLNIFPEMDSDSMEFRGIVDDIKTNGYDKSKPISIAKDKKGNDCILKGWNRARAVEIATKESGKEIIPEMEYLEGTDLELWESLKRDDLNRRQLKSNEIAMILVANQDFYNSVKEAVKDIEIDVKNNSKFAKQNANKTDAKIAKETGTNASTLARAKKLKEESPEKFEEVKQGKKTFNQAIKEKKQEKLSNESKPKDNKIEKMLDSFVKTLKSSSDFSSGMEYGRVINYAVKVINEELDFIKSWDNPQNDCDVCNGTGRSKDGKTKCPHCIGGKIGDKTEKFLEYKSSLLDM